MNIKSRTHERNTQAIKTISVIMSLLVYLFIVIYSEYHFFQLILGLDQSHNTIIGLVAIAASGITAFALPLAIHFWFRSGSQRTIGFIFYSIHFIIMAANLYISANNTSANSSIYETWILPAYIVFYAAGWSILWFLDDDAQAIDKIRELKMAEKEAALDRQLIILTTTNEGIKKAMSSSAAQQAINRHAAKLAPQILADELGISQEELTHDSTANYNFWEPQNSNSIPTPAGLPSITNQSQKPPKPPIPDNAPEGADWIWTNVHAGEKPEWVLSFPPITAEQNGHNPKTTIKY